MPKAAAKAAFFVPSLRGDPVPKESTMDGSSPFALLHRHGSDQVELLRGPLSTVERLADIPIGDGVGPQTLAIVPFRQLAERGFECFDDGSPLLCLTVESVEQIELDGDTELPPLVDLGFDIADDVYERIVGDVLEQEIGRGEGSNFVIHRTARAQAQGDPLKLALAAFQRLLRNESGAYWTFLVHLPGHRTFVGATPERHVSVDDGLVMMNPISGTFRHGPVGTPAEGDRERLLEFLADPKEINELSMVLDEELKMMAVVCEQGGQVLGPYLKRMSRLTHTEYLLAGRTTLDVREVLRQTMFAPTLTGSPIENAARVIARHEQRGRAYYGGVLALFGRDRSGTPTLDAPILFRCADISPDGLVRVRVGATLVRDSTPKGEVAETHAKAAGVLTALGLVPGSDAPRSAGPPADPEVDELLARRNDRLSRFWLTEREPAADTGLNVLIVDAEDTFTGMLAHLLRARGMRVDLRSTKDLPALAGYQLVVAGPGPGDPRDGSDPRVAALGRVIDECLSGGIPLFAVCLGHQVLSLRLGLEMHRRNDPYQGVPRDIHLFGQTHRVGFYSTFTALSEVDTVETPHGEVQLSLSAGEVNAVRGKGFAGVQFHLESVLTEHGPELLDHLLQSILEPQRIA